MARLLIGLAFLPTALCSLWAAARSLGDVTAAARDTLPFLCGFFGYPAIHFLFFRPVRLYVFGHELTHAMAAWMHGERVLNFVVGEKGGHVDLTHSNAAIALAPYVVPVYAALSVLSYRILLWAHPFQGAAAREVHAAFLVLIGACLSFHLVQTAHSLWDVRQPDLDQAGGIVFSLSLIILANGLLLILGLKCLFPNAVDAARSLRLVWRLSLTFWKAALLQVKYGAAWAARRWRPGRA